jgi:Holliday junction resolvase RusA-like endonuclease
MFIFVNQTPPSLNHSYRAYRGRVVLSQKARAFKQLVADASPEGFAPIVGPVKLTVVFKFKDKRKRDLDNYLKVLLDSLKGLYFNDDDQVYGLSAEKRIGCPNEGVEITLEAI